jgi:hypothetical protein
MYYGRFIPQNTHQFMYYIKNVGCKYHDFQPSEKLAIVL